MSEIKDCPDQGHCLNEGLIEELQQSIAELEENQRWRTLADEKPVKNGYY